MFTAWILLMLNSLFFTLRLSGGGSGSFPRPLKAEEERMYLERMAQGDLEARNILIEHNLRLVAHIMKKYYTPNGDQDDLISIGTIGLIKGISTFKPDKNVRLATYASRCIENEILMHFRAQRKLQGEVSLSDSIDGDGDGNSLSLMDTISVDDNMLEELDARDSCAKVRRCSAPRPAPTVAPAAPATPNIQLRASGDRQVIIGLGASTGGTEATLEVLKRLPADIPGMVIVQHMPVGFTKMYAERLNRLCRMEVKEAINGDEIRPGLALIAPADLQARVVRMGKRYTLSCLPGDKISGHRPSVDALFRSMASAVQCDMVGIIMTGMGRDGASGLLEMRKAGAYTIGQDKDSCVVYGMPMVAYDIGAVTIQASCDNIANVLLTYLKNRKHP